MAKKTRQHWFKSLVIKRDPDDWESREALMVVETNEWTRRGSRVNVWVTDLPVPEGKTTHWATSSEGDDYVSWETLRKFKKIVEDAEYERNRRRREGRELLVKYFTAVAAAIAALAALLNLYLTYRRM